MSVRSGSETPIVGVVSGKGGVGKTNLVANVAVAASRLGGRVLVVDGDLGLANLDVLLGLAPRRTAADVLDGACALEDALVEGPHGIHLLPASSGRADLWTQRPRELARLLVPLFRAAQRYDLVLLDAGAGLGPVVVGLTLACHRAILVTTPEPTALTDAYATLKVLGREDPDLPIELLVNGAAGAREARRVHEGLERVTRRFLESSPPLIGFLPDDPRLAEAVASQRAVVEAHPDAPSSRALVGLAQRLLRERPPRRVSSDASVSFPDFEVPRHGL